MSPLHAKCRYMSKKINKTSKFLSYVLRHQPEVIGLTLDNEGWADIPALIEGAKKFGHQLDEALIQTVVQTNDKKRFALSPDMQRIRAVQGHTTESVSISYVRKTPPETLFHGTAQRFLDSIRKEGLKPGTRHHVHLSENAETAQSVGSRYGTPEVLEIEALRMHQLGYEFFQADNGVWLIKTVPPVYIKE